MRNPEFTKDEIIKVLQNRIENIRVNPVYPEYDEWDGIYKLVEVLRDMTWKEENE